jgi:hypothetical protein
MCLKQCTKQDFGNDKTKWENWINKNVEPTSAGDAATRAAPEK